MARNERMNQSKCVEVLQEKLITFMNCHNCEIFQHDSAPCHKAASVTTWLPTNNIEVVDWPGNSPDLNPIENLWQSVKLRVSKTSPSTLIDLQNAIREARVSEISFNMC